MEELTGIDEIRQRLEQLTTQTRFEVLAFVPGERSPRTRAAPAARWTANSWAVA
ncbi:hypothetical protein ACFQZC_37410 [Streptacidiphilus monticola]